VATDDGDVRVRGVSLPKNYQGHYPASDIQLMKEFLPPREGTMIESDTHVLLAATSSTGSARETSIGGAFTRAFLKLLDDPTTHDISYDDVVELLPELPGYASVCCHWFLSLIIDKANIRSVKAVTNHELFSVV
jgi:hypothetical protein